MSETDEESINYADPWDVIQAAYDALFSVSKRAGQNILHDALIEHEGLSAPEPSLDPTPRLDPQPWRSQTPDPDENYGRSARHVPGWRFDPHAQFAQDRTLYPSSDPKGN